MLRGDTEFSQTEHLDRWDDDPRVRFIFGYEATPNLKAIAEDLPARPGSRLQRPARYEVKTQPAAAAGQRQGGHRGRGAGIREPAAALGGGRRVQLSADGLPEDVSHGRGPQEHLAWRKASSCCSIEVVYFFYITNDWVSEADEIVFAANDRCDQENLLAQLHGGVRALRAPVDNLESNWAYMVMTALAWNLKAWWALTPAGAAGALAGEAPGGEALGAAAGVQDVRECLRASAVPDRPDGPEVGVSACWVGIRTSRSSSAWWTCCAVEAAVH